MKTTITLFLSFLLAATQAQYNKQINDTIYRTITVVQADSLITANAGNPDFIIIDVRTPSEFATSFIAGAININYYGATFDSIIQALDHSMRYLLYCGSGSRSTQTFIKMQTWHFLEVYNMQGGLNAWLGAGYPVVTTTAIASVEIPVKNPMVFPNPVSQILYVTIHPSFTGNLSIIDIAGNVIFSRTSVSGVQQIDVAGYISGIYFIRFEWGSKVFTGKVIVN